ncbi:unnamed protein product [Phytomonas sp. EM1]|nr:unnamed protein product [Phytomonas sp. EM1]|eukprot:CCW65837.1 unnamed protein product [Phytomonas sp. isolate EM1]
MSKKERQAARSPYGVRAGFFGLDFANDFSAVGALSHIHLSEMNDERWTKYLPVGGPEHPHSQELTDVLNVSRFVSYLYQRAYAAHGDEIYTSLTVPRWDKGKRASRADHITLTPPLLALKQRPIDTVNNKVRRAFPVIFHTSNLELGHTKVTKMEYAAVGAPWLVPIAHNRKAKREIWKYLASAPLFLSTNKTIIQDSYHARCGFPFERTIEKMKYL